MKRTLIGITAAAALAALALAGCSRLDVVGTTAVSTFATLVEKQAAHVRLDADSGRWFLTSPGAERFEFSSDFSTGGPSFRLSFDAAPFLEAGLDPARLSPVLYSYEPSTRILSLSFEVGKEGFAYKGAPTPLDTFKEIVRTHRPIVGYHAALDHYGISLGDGNMFEWAKDMGKNDKDMVFVLNPEPLVGAGVDPAKVTGWIFTKVPVRDSAGRDVKVDKFVKPYDLGS
jgi:hypothetical protein